MKLLFNNKLESICPDFLPLAPPLLVKREYIKTRKLQLQKESETLKETAEQFQGAAVQCKSMFLRGDDVGQGISKGISFVKCV